MSAVKAPAKGTVTGPGNDTWFLDDASEANNMLHDLASTWPGLEVTTASPAGKPAAAIVTEAEWVGADLIVVGNKHMQGMSRVLGAVAAEVAHHAPCDVLIVKTAD